MYLERRFRRWYALHDIPKDAQQALDKVRFVESLGTDSHSVAKLRAVILEARWRAAIEKARHPQGDAIERDASYWREALKGTPEEERDLIRSLIADEAQGMVHKAADKLGITNDDDPGYDELPAHKDAARFYAIATGSMVKLDEHLDEHLAALKGSLEAKTIDMRRSTIKRFCTRFPYINDVKRKQVQHWINDLSRDGKKADTLRRSLSELRGYWSYLQSIEAASDDALPFDKLSLPKASKNAKGDEREPFTAVQVVALLAAARAREDDQLGDLIELGMWSGGRIEELCALKVEQVEKDHFKIVDAKTKAGWRQVPIHSALRDTVKRLVKDSSDGYLLPGLGENKYQDRSASIGKRFGRMKTALRYGKRHVFHSIRHTVATLLENAKVPEGIAADILGHEKTTQTYGGYSGGASMKTKKAAIEKLHYPCG